MQIKQAVEQLVASVDIPEEKLLELYHAQYTRPKKSVFLNMLFFVIGIILLIIGVYKTYLFTSQQDPHGAVLKRIESSQDGNNRGER